MRWLVVILASCGFRAGQLPTDATTADADDVDVARVDDAIAPADILELDTPPPPPIELRQINFAYSSTNMLVVAVPFTQAQLAGSLNVVVVGWYPSSNVVSIADTSGNSYSIAAAPAVSGMEHQTIYYACGIPAAAAGTNAVTVTFGAAQQSDVHVIEYTGVRASACFDGASSMAGSGTAMDSGPMTTTYARDLLVAATFQSNVTTAGDPAYTSRGINNFGDLVQDRVVSAVGTYNALATHSTAADWVIQLAAFKGQ